MKEQDPAESEVCSPAVRSIERLRAVRAETNLSGQSATEGTSVVEKRTSEGNTTEAPGRHVNADRPVLS